MKKSIVVFFCLLLSTPLAARDKTDVVFMKNGDRLTCEIKGLDSGVLYVNVDCILGTQSVDWSQVEHLNSKHLFIVRTQDGSTYTGTLYTMETRSARTVQLEVVENQGHRIAPDPRQVVQVEQSSEKFLERLSGSINSGITYSKGNQTTQYNLTSDVEYRRERWSAGASFDSSLSTSSGVTASTRNYANLNGVRLAALGRVVLLGAGRLPAELRAGDQATGHFGRRLWTLFEEHKPHAGLVAGRLCLAGYEIWAVLG